MIELKIHTFSVHKNLSIKFTKVLTLLDGHSGVGKSTVLRSIIWCLYGKPKTSAKEKTHVEITVSKRLRITRSKKPNELKVTTEDGTYYDNEAQSIIYKHFSSQRIFEIASYIPQKSWNVFFSLNNNEKMKVLNTMAFGDSDPSDFISKLDAHLSITSKDKNKVDIEVDKIKQLLESHVDRYIKDREIYNVEESEINELETYLKELKDKKQKIIELKEKKRKILTKLELLKKEEKEIKERIKKDSPFVDLNVLKEEIEELSKEESSCLIQIKETKRNLQLVTEIEKVKSKIIGSRLNKETNHKRYKLEELKHAQKVELQFQRNEEIARKLGVNYNEKEINEKIDELQRLIEIQPQLQQIQSNRGALVKLYEQDYEIPNKESLELELEKQKKRLNLLQLSLDILECPKCFASLRYKDKKLVESEVQRSDVKEIQATRTRISELQSRIEEAKELIKASQINKETYLALKDTKQLTKQGSQKILKLVSLLRSIEFIEKPQPSVKEITENIEYFTNVDKLKELESYLKPSTVNVSVLEQKAKKLKHEIEGKRNILENETLQLRLKEELKSKLSKVSKEIKRHELELEAIQETEKEEGIETCDSNVDEYENECERVKEEIEFSKHCFYYCELYAKLKTIKEEQNKLQKRYLNLSKLKQIAIDVECQKLQELVDTLNEYMEEYLSFLFMEPICLELKLQKELKTTKNVKPQVNLSIFYKGNEYDNISQLSIGEADRVSLALTLAFSKVVGTNILMLDESMVSFEIGLRGKCLELIREMQIENVICVEHVSVEGDFDEKISLN